MEMGEFVGGGGGMRRWGLGRDEGIKKRFIMAESVFLSIVSDSSKGKTLDSFFWGGTTPETGGTGTRGTSVEGQPQHWYGFRTFSGGSVLEFTASAELWSRWASWNRACPVLLRWSDCTDDLTHLQQMHQRFLTWSLVALHRPKRQSWLRRPW